MNELHARYNGMDHSVQLTEIYDSDEFDSAHTEPMIGRTVETFLKRVWPKIIDQYGHGHSYEEGHSLVYLTVSGLEGGDIHFQRIVMHTKDPCVTKGDTEE